MDGENRTMWIFEPSAAEQVFEDYVKEFGIEVHRDEWLDREKGVVEDGDHRSITTLSGKTYPGKMFIDATYEGDLMAAAGVDYHVGREANSVYGEEHNGVQVGVLHHRITSAKCGRRTDQPLQGARRSEERRAAPRQHRTSGWRTSARATSACRPTASACAYTNVPENRIPFPKPEGYDAKQYELLLRVLNTGLARDLREVRSDSRITRPTRTTTALQHRQHRL
jgi:hypothetical protein